MSASALPVLALFACAFAVLLSGVPVAFALAGSALACAAVGHLFGTFDLALLHAVPSRIFGTAMFNEVLTAVPLFILMGVTLERSRLAEDLLAAMGTVFERAPAGLGVSVTLVGTLVAASTGIVGATVVAMTLIALPVMLRRGYDPAFAAGSICAAGTLGQIIPPSIVLVFLADQLSAAYQQAQRSAGHFSPAPVAISDLFAGALIPGLLMALAFAAYQVFAAWRNPRIAPRAETGAHEDAGARTARHEGSGIAAAAVLLAPLALIVCVLGSIIAGIATPTEAAGVGAFGAVLLAARKLLREDAPALARLADAGFAAMFALALIGAFGEPAWTHAREGTDGLAARAAFIAAVLACLVLAAAAACALFVLGRRGLLGEITASATRFSALAFTILVGATIFTLVFRGLGGDEVVGALLEAIPGGTTGALIAVSLVIFALGFVLDFIEIVFIVLPVVAPAILMSDIDPVWFGVLVAINLQTSFLTPPFGFALFYFRGAAPARVSTGAIYRGVAPFIAIQLGVLVLVAMFPALATWLPGVLGR